MTAHWSDVRKAGFHTTVSACAQLAAGLPLAMVSYSFAGQWGDLLCTQLPSLFVLGITILAVKNLKWFLHTLPQGFFLTALPLSRTLNAIASPAQETICHHHLLSIFHYAVVWDLRFQNSLKDGSHEKK